MTGDRFDHDPTDSRDVPGDAPTSFDEAKAAADDGDAEGLGFVVTRHDPFLVVEVANGRIDGGLPAEVEPILTAFGVTFAEADDDGLLRLFYRGRLPGNLHGGDPVVVTVGGEERNYAFRLFDSGWTPVSGRQIPGTPEDLEEIDADALRRFLSRTGKL